MMWTDKFGSNKILLCEPSNLRTSELLPTRMSRRSYLTKKCLNFSIVVVEVTADIVQCVDDDEVLTIKI